MTRLLRSLVLVVAVGCGVEDYGKDLPVTQVPVDPPPPLPTPSALTLVVEGGRVQGVAGGTAMVKVRVPDRAQLASVLTITLESPPAGFSMPPANLAVGADTTTLSLRTSVATPGQPERLTFALTSVRGEEGRVSVPAEIAGRPGTQDGSFFTDPSVVKLGSSLPQIVVDPAGRTIVSGTEIPAPQLPPPPTQQFPRTGAARLLSTGGLDYGFGNEVGSLGIVHFTPKDAVRSETVQAIAVDGTSRVYGAVTVQGAAGPSYLQRLQANGQVDMTFGTDGRVRFSDFSSVYGAVTDRDGVVTCGREWANRDYAFLRRFLADGRKDPSFASDWLSLDARVTSVQNLVRTPGGRFAFAATSATGWLVFLAEVDGVPVSTFGDGGSVLLPFDGLLTGLAVTDDAVFAYGAKNTVNGRRGRIVKLRRDGVRDPSFGTPGEPAGELVSTTTQSIARVVVDGSGRLVVVGRVVAGSAAVLERWLPTGKPDTGFGVGGRVQFAGVSDDFQSVTVRPNGRILTVHRITSTVPTLQVTQFWD